VAVPTVLIVDDDDPTRRLFRIILEGEGFACEEAGDTAAALEIVAKGVDIVLCDVRLGDEDGLGLAETLLSREQLVGVVMVTGVDDPKMAETAIALGAYGYLVKPVRRSELLLNVTNAVRRRELELRQRELVTGLEARVLDRTSELQEALNRVEQAEVVRSQFVQNVSHELRTPLTVILAGAGLITRAPDPDRLASIASSIETQGRRLLLLIERLLEVASLDEGPSPSSTAPVDVRGLLAMAADPARALGRSVTIDVADGVTLVGSQQRLLSAFSHLVDNALKFTPPTSSVAMRAGVEGDGTCLITVADDGPGIPADVRERVWEPFVQVDGSSVREHGGLGVGLYLCRRLVEWHGGSVSAHDTPGGGLTVDIRLPVRSPG
jgi:signal transduction histidine kinase